MKILKWTLWIVLGLLIVVQFFRGKLPQNSDDTKNDIIVLGVVPGEVASVLNTSCYDCHSNQVRYPWYSYVAPGSWLVAHDVKEGREELNFSEWGTYNKHRQSRKLGEIKEQVEKGEMPMPIYTTMHRNAKLSEAQKAMIVKWVADLGAKNLE